MRQATGIESCRLQPMIRHHLDGDYRVGKLDLNYINYDHVFKTDDYHKHQKMISHKKSKSMVVAPKPKQSIDDI